MRGTLDVDVRDGSLAAVGGDSVAISETLARAGGLSVGGVLHARLADATEARLRVVAIYANANGFGDVILPHALALSHAVAPLDRAVFVAGGDAPAVAHALAEVVRETPSAVALSRSGYLQRVEAGGRDQVRAQWVVVSLMIAVAIMGAFSTGAMAAAERRGELALARLNGASRVQIAGALTLEAAAASLVAVVVGTVVALASLTHAGDDPTGGPLAVPWGQLALVVGGGLALGLLGVLVPAALVGRVRAPAGARVQG
jgi:putative ABC transport system permease protein